MFYSVPYDNGFTAYVDGEETQIEKVFGGLCAVKVSEGEHTVRFEYEIPGLKAAEIISAASAVVLLGYIITVIIMKRKNK